MMKALTALTGIAMAAGLATSALAATEMEQALADGAEHMTAEAITERLANKTVTFENLASGGTSLVYYDGDNGFLLQPLGSEKVIEGFYAVDLADHICLGVESDEPMKLRCVNVLLIDGMMHKFELDGSLRGRVVEEAEGNLV